MLINIWFILTYVGMYHVQKLSLINLKISTLNAAELSTLTSV